MYAKIYLKGNTLPMKFRLRQIDPPLYVFVGYDFMPDAVHHTATFYEESTFILQGQKGSQQPNSYVGFCFVALEYINTMAGCAFATKKSSSQKKSAGTLPNTTREDPFYKYSFHELANVKLEYSSRRHHLNRGQSVKTSARRQNGQIRVEQGSSFSLRHLQERLARPHVSDHRQASRRVPTEKTCHPRNSKAVHRRCHQPKLRMEAEGRLL